jgi:AraC-like DNA-binding protein
MHTGAPTYQELLPAPALDPFVRCYWQLQGGTPVGGVVRRILPDGCADVIFELGERSRFSGGSHPRARWVGTMTRAVVLESHGVVDTFGVRFAPGGLWALSRMPLYPLTDHHVALVDADPLRLAWLVEPLATAPSFVGRKRLVDTALTRALAFGVSLPTVARLIAKIQEATDIPTVVRLEELSGYTARTLERRFPEALGVTPKQYLRFLRFERARRLLRSGMSGAEVAAEAGYADQAHLSHEFRRLAGISPTGFARESGRRVGFLQDEQPEPAVLEYP